MPPRRRARNRGRGADAGGDAGGRGRGGRGHALAAADGVVPAPHAAGGDGVRGGAVRGGRGRGRGRGNAADGEGPAAHGGGGGALGGGGDALNAADGEGPAAHGGGGGDALNAADGEGPAAHGGGGGAVDGGRGAGRGDAPRGRGRARGRGRGYVGPNAGVGPGNGGAIGQGLNNGDAVDGGRGGGRGDAPRGRGRNRGRGRAINLQGAAGLDAPPAGVGRGNGGGRGHGGGRGPNAALGHDHGGVGGPNAGEDGPNDGEEVPNAEVDATDLDDYGPAPAADPAIAAYTEALANFTHFEQLLSEYKEARKIPRQNHLRDVPVLQDVDCRLLEHHLRAYYDESAQFFGDHYPLTVPVIQDDGTIIHVPVTPYKEADAEERTHHIVPLRRPVDRAVLRFLVENYSGYAVAFQAYIEPDPEVEGYAALVAHLQQTVQWCHFGQEPLAARFGVPRQINYGPSYTSHLENVDLHVEYGSNLIDFALSFYLPHPEGNFNQPATAQGHIFLETFFVVFCEGRRFSLMEYWALRIRGRIPRPYPIVCKNYRALSTCVIGLRRYSLEESRSQLVGGPMLGFAKKSKDAAIGKWEKRQNALSHTPLIFYEVAGPGMEKPTPVLNRIAGTVLKLIRNADDDFDKVLMRMLGYNGRWLAKLAG